jgi:hypothetical protein
MGLRIDCWLCAFNSAKSLSRKALLPVFGHGAGRTGGHFPLLFFLFPPSSPFSPSLAQAPSAPPVTCRDRGICAQKLDLITAWTSDSSSLVSIAIEDEDKKTSSIKTTNHFASYVLDFTKVFRSWSSQGVQVSRGTERQVTALTTKQAVEDTS